MEGAEDGEGEDTTGQEVAVAAAGIHVQLSVETERPSLMVVLVMVIEEEVVKEEVIIVRGSTIRTGGG